MIFVCCANSFSEKFVNFVLQKKFILFITVKYTIKNVMSMLNTPQWHKSVYFLYNFCVRYVRCWAKYIRSRHHHTRMHYVLYLYVCIQHQLEWFNKMVKRFWFLLMLPILFSHNILGKHALHIYGDGGRERERERRKERERETNSARDREKICCKSVLACLFYVCLSFKIESLTLSEFKRCNVVKNTASLNSAQQQQHHKE